MAFVHEIHSNRDAFVYTCNICKAQTETRWHCQTCDDFDLCVSCYNKMGHPHQMVRLGLDLDGKDETSATVVTAEQRNLSMQRGIASLVHACSCRDANCSLSICERLKKVVAHAKTCKLRKVSTECSLCKQLITLVGRHAKQCKETKCPVPFCSGIREKLRRKTAEQRNLSMQPPLKELMQEFRALLRAPQTPQQKEKARQLLRANPALLTILSMVKAKKIKAKQQNQLRQQQQHMAAQQMSQPMNPTHSTALLSKGKT